MNSGVTGKQLIMTTDMADFQDVSINYIFCGIYKCGKHVYRET